MEGTLDGEVLPLSAETNLLLRLLVLLLEGKNKRGRGGGRERGQLNFRPATDYGSLQSEGGGENLIETVAS